MRARRFQFVLCTLTLLAGVTAAQEPCVSGLKPGQRPGPYSAVVSTGPQRGQSHCFICETGDKPAVIVFARSLSDGLGRLAQEIDRSVARHEKAELRGWMTFVNEDQVNFDPKLVRWSQKYALRNTPTAVFEDKEGPPSYRLSREADVTVLFSVNQKVVANHVFRAGELNDAKIAVVMKDLAKLVK